jgi:hypothetical protein
MSLDYTPILGLSFLQTIAHNKNSRNSKSGAERLEQLYSALKPHFFSGNGVQALAEVLVLGERTPEIVERVLALKQLLRDCGLKMENQCTLAVLGILTLLPGAVDVVARDVAETFEYLRAQEGFGAWSFTKQELELFASALAAYDLTQAARHGLLATALSTSLTNIVIAQQAAMAVVAAT